MENQMKKYRVTWIETPIKTWFVNVDANSPEEAIKMVENNEYTEDEDILDEYARDGRANFQAEEINE